jgi:CRP/FNR family transcriptional regulator, cyclic AMP receptor protein
VASAAEIVAFLRQVRLFRDISAQDLAALAGTLREHTMRRGQVLFREGDRGDAMYLVRHGTLIVSKAVTGRVDQVLARFGPGEFFGEMALFDRSPRSATIQADTEATLLTLDREHLERLIETNPRAAAEFFEALVHVFIDRLRATGDLVAEVTRWGLEATGLDIESR